MHVYVCIYDSEIISNPGIYAAGVVLLFMCCTKSETKIHKVLIEAKWKTLCCSVGNLF